MKISQYMTPDPITVSPDTPLPEARRILNMYRIRHLPVIDEEGRLAGIVTDRDLRSAYPSSVTTRKDAVVSYVQVEKTVVADIMTTRCAVLSVDATLDDALEILDREKVGGLPIIDEDERVVGFFSAFDLIGAYRKLFGMLEKGSILLGVEDDGRPGIVCELTSILEGEGIFLTRLLRLPEKRNNAKIYMRMNGKKKKEIERLLRGKGFMLIEGAD
jgi:acetoin utilization protein AcuB